MPSSGFTAAVDDMARQHSHRRLYSASEAAIEQQTFAPLVSISKRIGLASDPQAAAAQQAFHERTWVWVPDADKGYVSSWIIKEDKHIAECMGIDDKIRVISKDDYSRQNPPKFNQIEDMAELTHLNEASVVHNLETRFKHDRIYTYSGPFLVAVNPYRNLDAYYSPQAVAQYMNRRREENPPHIFAVAQQAWAQMISERESQSILVTGESGAGKTENTKKVIQFLTAIAADAASILPSSGSADSVLYDVIAASTSRVARRPSHPPDKKLGQLERQILQANPILEAFGNAQTVRNNNSSRFGKFVRIEFSANGAIAGAFIDWYLLEKSRVTGRSEQERSFHIFYELLRGASDKLKRDLLLDRPLEQYGFVANSTNKVDGLDDVEEWRTLERAFAIVGFSPQEQLNVLKIVAAILHLGNVDVGGKDRAIIENPAELEKAAQLLGLPIKEFIAALVSPRTRAGREWVTQSRTRQQVIDEIGSVCKTLYEKNFAAIVDRINQALERQTTKSTFIGVLDIAGFEIFQRNSFEQLCINYTNEKLQQFFNHHMFVLEQEEYEREEIGWQFENFGLDLQPTIDLIESAQPIGILACLDEECIMPKASDHSFLEKLKGLYTGRSPTLSLDSATPASKFSASRNEQLGFSVQHYAGKVEYSAEDWLSKNKDPLNENLANVLAASSDAYVSLLFSESAEPANGARRRATVKRGAFRTVGQRHKEQLHSLMTQLQSTSPHFVRCIVPNPYKRPAQISVPLVLDQLRCNGVLEGIRIARLGYPNRLPFVEFRHRYEVLTPNIIPKGYVDGRKACSSMLAALKLDPSEFKVGRTKAFFKAGVLADLEERRDELLYGIFTRIQAACRRFSARRSLLKVLNRAMAARTIQHNARIYLTLRDWPWWSLYTRVRPLLAATRADEELRRKEAELALAKEREQRDAQEKERLATLQRKADQEKKALQDAMESERLLREEQDGQLKRSIERERILQDNIESAEADIDRLLEAREQAQAEYAALQTKYNQLSDNFANATRILEQLEKDQSQWQKKEAEIVSTANVVTEERKAFTEERQQLLDKQEQLEKALVTARDNLKRLEGRAAATVKDHESKLSAVMKDLEAARSAHSTSETKAAGLQQQMLLLSKASVDYEGILKAKEAEVADLASQVATHKQHTSSYNSELAKLRAQLGSHSQEVEALKAAAARSAAAQSKAEQELSKLQASIATKATEDEQRNMASRQISAQLEETMANNKRLQAQLSEAEANTAKAVAESQAKVETLQADFNSAKTVLLQAQQKLTEQKGRIAELERTIAMADRKSSGAESELQALRAKQIQTDEDRQRLLASRDELERKLNAMTTRYQKLEESMQQADEDQGILEEQILKLKTLAEHEGMEHLKSEERARQLEKQLQTFQPRLTRQERICVDLQAEIEALTKQLEHSKALENKTTIEHVHTLEKAMKVQDRQLADAHSKIEEAQQIIRTLEKTRTRLTNELQDANFATHKDTSAQRDVEKKITQLEAQAKKALDSLQRERKAREVADSSVQKLRSELSQAQSEAKAAKANVDSLAKAKKNLEDELKNLAAASPAPAYQTFANVGSGKRHLLEELDRNSAEMANQMNARLESLSQSRSNTNLKSHASRPTSVDFSNKAGQVAALQILEIEKLSSDRVRRHLEQQVKEMAAIIAAANSPNFSTRDAQRQLDKENANLQDLLQQEAAARKEAEAARLQGSDALHSYHLKVKSSLDDRFTKLEDSRKALQAIQRQLQSENDDLRRELVNTQRAMADDKRSMDTAFLSLRRDYDTAINENDELRQHIQAMELDHNSNTDLEGRLAAIQNEAETYRDQIEAARIRERDAIRAETSSRMAQAELERVKNEAIQDREAAEARARAAEARARELEAAYGSDTVRYQVKSLERDIQRLQDDLQAERDQHMRSENDNDARVAQLQKTYQSQLEQLNAEFKEQHDHLSKSRADYADLKTAFDELQIRYEDETHSMEAWKHEKATLTDNWARAKKAFDEAVVRQGEFQSQNVELVQKNRDLRLRIDEVESDLVAALQGKRTLEERLQEFASSQAPTQDVSARAVELERDDLRKELEASQTRLRLAQSKQTSAEKSLLEQQRNVAREREEAQKFAAQNDDLQQQIKDLRVRLADFDGRQFASSPRLMTSRRADARVEELTDELKEERSLRAAATEQARAKEFQLQDLAARLEESEKVRKRLEGDSDGVTSQILRLRHDMTDLRNSESQAQLAASKSQREAETLLHQNNMRVLYDLTESLIDESHSLKSELDNLRKRMELGRSASTIGVSLARTSTSNSLLPTSNRTRESSPLPQQWRR